jgi:integrase
MSPRWSIRRRVRVELHPLSGDQSVAFLEASRSDRLGPLYPVAVATGMRQGELLGLRWADVDLEAGILGVRQSGRQDAPDGNIDLEVCQSGQRRIVQCKRWESWSVGVDQVRAFAGTLMREGLAGTDGVLVTLSDFTTQSRAGAGRTGQSLIDNRDLSARVERARQAEPCSTCHAARHGRGARRAAGGHSDRRGRIRRLRATSLRRA